MNYFADALPILALLKQSQTPVHRPVRSLESGSGSEVKLNNSAQTSIYSASLSLASRVEAWQYSDVYTANQPINESFHQRPPQTGSNMVTKPPSSMSMYPNIGSNNTTSTTNQQHSSMRLTRDSTNTSSLRAQLGTDTSLRAPLSSRHDDASSMMTALNNSDVTGGSSRHLRSSSDDVKSHSTSVNHACDNSTRCTSAEAAACNSSSIRQLSAIQSNSTFSAGSGGGGVAARDVIVDANGDQASVSDSCRDVKDDVTSSSYEETAAAESSTTISFASTTQSAPAVLMRMRESQLSEPMTDKRRQQAESMTSQRQQHGVTCGGENQSNAGNRAEKSTDDDSTGASYSSEYYHVIGLKSLQPSIPNNPFTAYSKTSRIEGFVEIGDGRYACRDAAGVHCTSVDVMNDGNTAGGMSVELPRTANAGIATTDANINNIDNAISKLSLSAQRPKYVTVFYDNVTTAVRRGDDDRYSARDDVRRSARDVEAGEPRSAGLSATISEKPTVFLLSVHCIFAICQSHARKKKQCGALMM